MDQSKKLIEYRKLVTASKDFELAKFSLDMILRKHWHRHWLGWGRGRRGKVYEKQAVYTTALIIAYARPFTNNKGGGGISKNSIKAYTPEEKKLHGHLLSLRNTLYAHSDSKHHKHIPIHLKSRDGASDIIDLPLSDPFMITKEQAESLSNMLTKMLGYVTKHAQDLARQLPSL
jgi:hypothetical protein